MVAVAGHLAVGAVLGLGLVFGELVPDARTLPALVPASLYLAKFISALMIKMTFNCICAYLVAGSGHSPFEAFGELSVQYRVIVVHFIPSYDQVLFYEYMPRARNFSKLPFNDVLNRWMRLLPLLLVSWYCAIISTLIDLYTALFTVQVILCG